MGLTSIQVKDPETLSELRVDQVIVLAGDGKLKDGSVTSEEFRAFLRAVPLNTLKKFTQETLEKGFQDSGFVLQDLVNEVGRRLGYTVENGRYRGVVNQVGHDGLWLSSFMRLVIEVKTTDAYRINLSTLASYAVSLGPGFSNHLPLGLLIVVGRQDTGDLEAQIRGSKFAWDVRVISVDSLLELASLIEVAVDKETEDALRSALLPVEYTRVDYLIELLSKLAFDVERSAQAGQEEEGESSRRSPSPDTSAMEGASSNENVSLEALRDIILTSIERTFGANLARQTKSRYLMENRISFILSLSKRYSRNDQHYWYAFQSKWVELLDSENAYLCLGMQDKNFFLRIPGKIAIELKEHLNKTEKTNKLYWHLGLTERSEGLLLSLPKAAKLHDLSEFMVMI